MKTRLFVVPGSHPSLAGRLMMERKGIPYSRVDLVPALHKLVVRAAGFGGVTVPALRIEGRKVQGTRDIAVALDEIQPEPRLLPEDRDHRARVEEANRFGDEVLQPMPRRMVWWALRRDRSALGSYSQGARLGLPVGLAVKTAAPFVRLSARFNEATDDNVRADLDALPGVIDRVDAYIADGTIGGDEPNLADFQIATSVRLLMSFEDFREAIAARPAGRHAMRLVPDYPGVLPRAFPDPPDLTVSEPRTS